MKNYLLPLFASIYLFACNTKTVRITGEISPVKDSILKFEYELNDSIFTAESKIENGRFSFQKEFEEPVFILIRDNAGYYANVLVAPNSDTELSINDGKNTIINGSELTNTNELYHHVKTQKSKDSIVLALSKSYINDTFFVEFLETWLLFSKPDFDVQQKVKKSLLNSQNPSKNMDKLISNYFERNEATRKGKIIPRFKFPNNRNILSSVISEESPYTLIDFWATWCIPCQSTNTYLVWAKERLAKKGIRITSVSIEKDFETWKSGSMKENITWNSVIDTARVTMDSLKYGLIPFAILVNQEGEIIISNVRDEDIVNLVENKEVLPSK